MPKTRITELFGIEHPIVLAGMNWITEPKLVSAVCNAGGLGILATARMSPEEIHKNVAEVRKLTSKPFAVNQILRSPNAKQNMEAILQEKVPIINYSLGKPWFVDTVHGYGGKLIGTIAISKHAVAAEKLGADALIVTGHEAAAHGSAATSMILIPIVASMVKVPIIAAGGFSSGKGLAAALMLGADAISMGTRFMLTKESPLHDNFKQICLKSSEEDTLYSDAFDGLLSRVLKTKRAEDQLKHHSSVFEAAGAAMKLKKMMKISTLELIKASVGMMSGEEKRSLISQARQAAHVIEAQKAIYGGEVDKGILPVGQIMGNIRDLPSCTELISSIIKEADEVIHAKAKLFEKSPVA